MNVRILTGGRVLLWYWRVQGCFCKMVVVAWGLTSMVYFDRRGGLIWAIHPSVDGWGGVQANMRRRSLLELARSRATRLRLRHGLHLREAEKHADVARLPGGGLGQPWRRAAEGGGATTLVSAAGWWCLIIWKSNTCDCCPPLPFIVSRGGAQGEIQRSYCAWQLARPVVRRCPSGCIDAESWCLVGEAATWSGWTVPSGTLVLLPE
jgi:hypothetical protein